MQLLWPGFLALLAIPPLLVAAYVWLLRRRRAGVRYSSLALVRQALPRSPRRRHVPFALFVLSTLLLVVALARPAAIVAVPASEVTIVLAIDVSGSMCSTDIPPTRIQAAEQAAASFVKRQGPGTQIGIVAFSGFAELVQAPTTDHQALLDAIGSLATGRRTAIGSGILAAIDAIAEVDPSVARSQDPSSGVPGPTPVPSGAYAPDIIVLLTDGASNTGPAPLDAADEARARGLKVYTIGYGTANGGAFEPHCAAQFLGNEPFFGGGTGGFGGFGGFRRGIDEATLKQVAATTGGKYYPAESADQLNAVFASLPTNLIMKHDVVDISVGFLGAGAILMALALLLAQTWRPYPS